MSDSSYQPFLSIVETYETSDDLKCIKEILEFPEDDGVTVDFRNLIKEFQMTKWVSLKTELYSFPQDDETKKLHSNLLDKDTDEIYVYNFHYFD